MHEVLNQHRDQETTELGRRPPRDTGATPRSVIWADEWIGHHNLGMFTDLAKHASPYRRHLWYPICTCGWRSRQGFVSNSEAMSRWHAHVGLRQARVAS